MSVALLAFVLGDDRFAVPCDRVIEIIAAASMQTLPGAPAIVEGVLNVRGTVVPVLDIRQRFALAPNALHQDQHFIVVNVGGAAIALRVDRAIDVISVDESAVSTHAFTDELDHVAGVAVTGDGLLVIQDLDRFLAPQEVRDLADSLEIAFLPPA